MLEYCEHGLIKPSSCTNCTPPVCKGCAEGIPAPYKIDDLKWVGQKLVTTDGKYETYSEPQQRVSYDSYSLGRFGGKKTTTSHTEGGYSYWHKVIVEGESRASRVGSTAYDYFFLTSSGREDDKICALRKLNKVLIHGDTR